MEKMTAQDYIEIEAAMESVLDVAMESARGHIIDPKVRDCLPDKAFGIVFVDENGKTQRKYPLVVKNDPETTKELIGKAYEMFHFCRPQWKAELAKAIVRAIKSEKVVMKMNKKSQIFKYISEKDLPNTVTLIDTSKNA